MQFDSDAERDQFWAIIQSPRGQMEMDSMEILPYIDFQMPDMIGLKFLTWGELRKFLHRNLVALSTQMQSDLASHRIAQYKSVWDKLKAAGAMPPAAGGINPDDRSLFNGHNPTGPGGSVWPYPQPASEEDLLPPNPFAARQSPPNHPPEQPATSPKLSSPLVNGFNSFGFEDKLDELWELTLSQATFPPPPPSMNSFQNLSSTVLPVSATSPLPHNPPPPFTSDPWPPTLPMEQPVSSMSQSLSTPSTGGLLVHPSDPFFNAWNEFKLRQARDLHWSEEINRQLMSFDRQNASDP